MKTRPFLTHSCDLSSELQGMLLFLECWKSFFETEHTALSGGAEHGTVRHWISGRNSGAKL